jgi:hypothetical protein
MTAPPPAICAAPDTSANASTERLWVDMDGERQAAALRLLAAVLALGSGLWLMAVADELWLRGVGLTSCGFAVLWARRHWKQRKSQLPGQAHYLEIGEHHLALAEGADARSLPLSCIQAVEIDDDRLLVVLRLHDGEPWLIEPRYRGVGLRDLAERLYAAVEREQARASR